VPSCAECHRDHRGRDASLLAMDDSTCTSCHQNLADHRDKSAGPMLTAASVTRFDADPAHHPGFTEPTDVSGPDSGRIKFSHERHMAPGLTGDDQKPVQLRCEACHRLDGAEDGRALARTAGAPVVARASGALMLPVTYEHDCRACHPLPFEPKDPERQVRHGLKPREVVDELRRYYTAQSVDEDPVLLHRFIPPRPMPHRPITEASERAKKAAAEKTLIALRLLFGSAIDEKTRRDARLPMSRGGCVECHELKPASRPLVDSKAAENLEIKDVNVRPLWFESARFDHAAHRAVECAACHMDVEKSKDQSVPLLPKIGQCVECHAPPATRAGKPVGGAGVSCVECHRYHNGDHPAQGIGARARRGKVEMTLDEFLGGGPPRGH
jgi:predicted CXXCH cytochrome family protein